MEWNGWMDGWMKGPSRAERMFLFFTHSLWNDSTVLSRSSVYFAVGPAGSQSVREFPPEHSSLLFSVEPLLHSAAVVLDPPARLIRSCVQCAVEWLKRTDPG